MVSMAKPLALRAPVHSAGRRHALRTPTPCLHGPSARRPAPLCRAAPEDPQSSSSSTTSTSTTVTEAVTGASSNGNGNGAEGIDKATRGAAAFSPEVLSGEELPWQAPDDGAKFWTNFKLAFALPWRRIKKDTVLTFTLEGEIPDQQRAFFDSSALSVPALCWALRKAALDPRIQGIAMDISPLNIGWGKAMEIKRHFDHFRASGKYLIAYMKQGGEKEYYLASACSEIYAPPSAYIGLRGFVTGGTFLRGVLDKVGVEPQVKRIGAYKSAGDQLLRSTMAEEQREQLSEIQADVVEEFIRQIAESRGKTRQEVIDFINEGVYDVQRFKEGGWVTDLWYEDQLLEELKMRTLGLRPAEGESERDKEKREKALAAPLRRVGLKKYGSVSPSAFGLTGGKGRIVVLRTSGAILGKASSSSGSAITPDGLIPKLRALAKDKSVKAVVLRVDSPGGDAFASDLMWREIRRLDEQKPVIASMADVAASGGYYLSMAARAIVAEPLTITGSIGVVTGKFNLAELYGKIGYNKELISWGKYAELFADNRTFSKEEEELFDASAQHAYASFRNKAAASRGLEVEDMQAVAQGRVWSGRAAIQRRLVDALGGVNRAVAMAREAAGLKADEKVTVVEIGKARPSAAALLGGGASVGVLASTVLLGLLRGQSPAQALAAAAGAAAIGSLGVPAAVAGGSVEASAAAAVGPLVGSLAQQAGVMAEVLQPGRCAYMLTEVDALSIGANSSAAGGVMGAGVAGGAGAGAGGDGEGFLSEGSADVWIERVLGEW